MRPDPHDLARFVDAQEGVYEAAIAELRAGRKRSHWMWFIFPQYHGLGFSTTSQHFAIKSLEEARAYLEHPVLGARLLECARVLLDLETSSATEVFGHLDDMKLRSSATLFARAAPSEPVFQQLLLKFFSGRADETTEQLVAARH